MAIMMEEALDRADAVAARYGRIARLYDRFTDYEQVQHGRAAALADLDSRGRVLDVACGTGRGLAALSGRLEPDVARHGVDLTPAMLERARRKLGRMGLGAVCDLRIGNAAALPFADGEFDLVYSGYFFDLVKLELIDPVLREMGRVLRPGGQLVLVNMSKNVAERTRYERLYQEGRLGIFSGGCRPVLMGDAARRAGFTGIERHYYENRSLFALNRMFGTEILLARKPG